MGHDRESNPGLGDHNPPCCRLHYRGHEAFAEWTRAPNNVGQIVAIQGLLLATSIERKFNPIVAIEVSTEWTRAPNNVGQIVAMWGGSIMSIDKLKKDYGPNEANRVPFLLLSARIRCEPSP